jgi:hypothetical protein
MASSSSSDATLAASVTARPVASTACVVGEVLDLVLLSLKAVSTSISEISAFKLPLSSEGTRSPQLSTVD